MIKYTGKRIVLIFVTLFIILSLSFFLIKLLPDNTELSYLLNKVSKEDYELMRKRWGYDQPLFIQYLHWLKTWFSLELGRFNTYKNRENTFVLITEKLPITMRLNLISLFSLFLWEFYSGL